MKRKNYYQVHNNKKPKLKCIKRPSKAQLEKCYESFTVMTEALIQANYAMGTVLESITVFKAIHY